MKQMSMSVLEDVTGRAVAWVTLRSRNYRIRARLQRVRHGFGGAQLLANPHYGMPNSYPLHFYTTLSIFGFRGEEL